ncbi:hypothetical protein E7T09_12110 [Deinococcus sp. KSM4-11]|uniref:hypothetical protein n=1 Tax=Deinococcus sp. KSM4-11 TaxID=2568654 RepID=UPI0010A4B16C|nr:hypothetical protein [Deinococcus sp. KSM4-11]THF86819.1 hypothetical protein E7T09_12110 [Deinococcus sp. KSM4-11]
MDIAGIPFVTVQFGRLGEPLDPQEGAAAVDMVRSQNLTDVLVFSHGWNNNIPAAMDLYTRFLTNARPLLDGPLKAAFEGRRLGAVGIVWPSMRYTEPELIPGGAASADLRPKLKEDLEAAQELFQGVTGSPIPDALEELARNLAVLEDKGSVRRDFLNAVRAHLAASETEQHEVPIPQRNLTDDRVRERLATNVQGVVTGGPEGHAAGLFSGALQVFRNLLNVTTYYEMKDRAGLVGRTGVRDLLRALRSANPAVKLHLIGHSFGGRLVSSAARGPDGDAPLVITSLNLLQAAFSHYAFAEAKDDLPEGYFRPVLTDHLVSGPLLVTHTRHDLAVGLAYAVASALAGQDAAGIGDEHDRYGGLGGNGALNAGAVELTLQDDTPLAFEGGRVYNLHADIIKDHGDVTRTGVVRAVLHGVAAT